MEAIWDAEEEEDAEQEQGWSKSTEWLLNATHTFSADAYSAVLSSNCSTVCKSGERTNTLCSRGLSFCSTTKTTYLCIETVWTGIIGEAPCIHPCAWSWAGPFVQHLFVFLGGLWDVLFECEQKGLWVSRGSVNVMSGTTSVFTLVFRYFSDSTSARDSEMSVYHLFFNPIEEFVFAWCWKVYHLIQ